VVIAVSDQVPVQVAMTIRNRGYVTSLDSELRLYDDHDFDNLPEDEELTEREVIPPIAVGNSLLVGLSHLFERGHHAVIALLDADDDTSNNVNRTVFSVGPITGEIIITEFLANPEGTLETEWVELRNMTSRIIDLTGWMIGDSLHQHAIGQCAPVAPGAYVVLAQDTAAFAAFYGGGCFTSEAASWASLNNNGDRIVLRDDFGVISDSLTYSNVGDENHSVELNELEESSMRNWYVSTSAAGSTPCSANSVSGAFTEEIEVMLLNRVFSPRLGEQLGYRVGCPPGTAFVIEVFDLAGRRHWTVANSVPMSTGDFFYEGQSEQYGMLPPGAYVLKVEVVDGRVFSRKIGFAVADAK